MSLYAGVFVLVNATYFVLCWEVIDRRNFEDVPPSGRKIMYIRSLVTLGLFATAALIALRYSVGGMALICLCLAVYVQPEAPGVKAPRSDVASTGCGRQNLLGVASLKKIAMRLLRRGGRRCQRSLIGE